MSERFYVRRGDGPAYEWGRPEVEKQLASGDTAEYLGRRTDQVDWLPLGQLLDSPVAAQPRQPENPTAPDPVRVAAPDSRLLTSALVVFGLLGFGSLWAAWDEHLDSSGLRVRTQRLTGATRVWDRSKWVTPDEYAKRLAAVEAEKKADEAAKKVQSPPVVFSWGPVNTEKDKHGVDRKYRLAFQVTNTLDKPLHGVILSVPGRYNGHMTHTVRPQEMVTLNLKAYVGETVALTAHGYPTAMRMLISE